MKTLALLYFLLVTQTNALQTLWAATRAAIGRKKIVHMVATEMSAQTAESLRLKKARLRLAEAQGIIPIGASEDQSVSLDVVSSTAPSLSKVREISWRVAEPAVKYDPVSASSKLFAQPIRWLVRNIQFLVPVSMFVSGVVFDILTGSEERKRPQRADELLNLLSAQSPALIKAGQVLSSRSDLLPKEYLDSLEKLQDRCPAFPNDEALAMFRNELGMDLDEVIDLERPDPVAAASIGQVYKGTLRSK